MYTRHFGLREYPFGLTSDLRFFFKAPLHEEVHTNIATAIRERKGLVLLTGEPGTGKTTLLHQLARTLSDTAQILWLPLAAPTFAEILTHLCEQCALPCSPHDSTDSILACLKEHLRKETTRAKTVVLFIDEAQHLDPDILRHLSQLLRLEGPQGKLLQIVLAGHPELEEHLAHPKAQLLHQDLASWQRLSPFPNECIETYIRHRLTVAGCDRPELFTPEAIRTVGFYSHAIPRLINVICDNALLTAYRLDLPIIPLEVIVQVVDELQLPTPSLAANDPPTVPSTRAPRLTLMSGHLFQVTEFIRLLRRFRPARKLFCHTQKATSSFLSRIIKGSYDNSQLPARAYCKRSAGECRPGPAKLLKIK